MWYVSIGVTFNMKRLTKSEHAGARAREEGGVGCA
jgi:hypothetical protein